MISTQGMKEFSFYDGPPFATGTPHYGHILAGTIKDTVTRYAHMDGHHVTRRFGFDSFVFYFYFLFFLGGTLKLFLFLFFFGESTHTNSTYLLFLLFF